MAISDRIEAIEQHLTDDYSVLTLAGADLTNVDKNIVNLKTTWKERLLYFMNNGTDEVWNNWDKVTGEGEEISLNNTLEAKMKIVLKGNTLQNGTPTPDSPVPIQVVSGDNSIVVCGKNLALNDNPTNPDANYTSSGGGTSAVQYDSANGGYYTTSHRIRNLSNLSAGTYTLSIDLKTRQTGTYAILVVYTDSTGTNPNLNRGAFIIPVDITNDYARYTKTYTLPSGYDTIRLIFYSTIYWNDIMLEKGNQATTYEPYTGASYFVNLGKNLLYNQRLPMTQANVNMTYNNGTFGINGTASISSNAYIIDYSTPLTHLESGESLTYYIERVSGTSKVAFLTYFIPDDGSSPDYTWGVTLVANTNSNKVVKTATKSGKYSKSNLGRVYYPNTTITHTKYKLLR